MLSLLFSWSAFAQPQNDKVESLKIAFFTQRLELTPEEATAFWPVYNQYQNELDAIRIERKKDRNTLQGGFINLSDKEVEKIVDNEILFQKREIEVKEKYHLQFKQVLPIKKVAMLYKAEYDFKKKLIEEMKKRQNRPGGGPGGRG